MNIKNIAKALGRRGGLARAKKLSSEKRKEIASAGAQARIESLTLAKKIETNFRYLATIRALRPLVKIKSVKKVTGKLPGIYG